MRTVQLLLPDQRGDPSRVSTRPNTGDVVLTPSSLLSVHRSDASAFGDWLKGSMKTYLPASKRAPREAGSDAVHRCTATACTRSFAIIITDHDGTIDAWSKGAQDMFGYGEAEMVGGTLSTLALPQLMTSQEINGHKNLFDSSANAGWYRHKNGTHIFCREARSTLANRPGEALRHVWFLCDDTSLHKRFEALQRKLIEQEVLYGEAVSADASKDRSLALISHELKQPLATILMGVERLLELTSGTDSKRITDNLHAIRSATQRQAKIVNDLMELSRIRTGKIRLDPVLINVGELVYVVATTIAEGSPDRSIQMCIDHSGDHQCLVDPVRLEQIVSNLLNNAIKFSGSGGRIEVCVRSAEGFAKVSVADDGIGISQEFLPYVFSMFGQETRSDSVASEGLGLGLAIVKELAQAHGGRVGVRSDGPGRGSRFTVWLPLASVTTHPGPSSSTVDERLRA